MEFNGNFTVNSYKFSGKMKEIFPTHQAFTDTFILSFFSMIQDSFNIIVFI